MAETNDPVHKSHLTQIEPDDRLVVLARAIQAQDAEAETVLKDSSIDWTRFGETCCGAALYRHRSVFQNDAEAPVWSHLELTYFRNTIPANAIRELVENPQAAETNLLRAEILLTTPSSFVLPRNWQGSIDRPEWQASLEYIQVHPAHLHGYREVMREYCGPAATKIVSAGRFGTFRAMETAAVLYRAPELNTEWNQLHLCELNPNDFSGFGREFEAAHREESPDSANLDGTFSNLDRMRRVPRWTFNDPVVELDAAVAKECWKAD